MKISFDEHVPAGLVRVFESLCGERKVRNLIGATGKGMHDGYTVVRSRDYNLDPTDPNYIKGSDVGWIQKFSDDGGQVIISGDVRMMAVPQEVVALQKNGLITFFFEAGWNQWNFFQKASLLLFYWESVIASAQSATKGDVFRIPAVFSKTKSLELVCREGQLQLMGLSIGKKEDAARAAHMRLKRKRTKVIIEGQSTLVLHKEE